jgi:hypothetical protein
LCGPTAHRALHQLVYEACPYQHQPNEPEDTGILECVVKILVESLAKRMVGYQRQLSRANQPVGDPVGIAHAGIRLA